MNETEIKYDTPIVVSQTQYNYLMNRYAGVVAGRFDGVKYYIKIWLMSYSKSILNYLKQPK
jgi:hypothetical protein